MAIVRGNSPAITWHNLPWDVLDTDQKRVLLMMRVMCWEQGLIDRVMMAESDHDELSFFPLGNWNHTMQLVEQAIMDGNRLQCDWSSTQDEICEEILSLYPFPKSDASTPTTAANPAPSAEDEERAQERRADDAGSHR